MYNFQKIPTNTFGLKYKLTLGSDSYDNADFIHSGGRTPPKEFSDNNVLALRKYFAKIRDKCRCILEIGVCRNEQSSTGVFITDKRDETVYLGVDIEDKSFLINPEKNIYTIKCDSADKNFVYKKIDESWRHEIDFLFIDGWHSINQVYLEWEAYVPRVPVGGIIGLHDTSAHPGPIALYESVDERYFDKVKLFADRSDDWGISFLVRKNADV